MSSPVSILGVYSSIRRTTTYVRISSTVSNSSVFLANEDGNFIAQPKAISSGISIIEFGTYIPENDSIKLILSNGTVMANLVNVSSLSTNPFDLDGVIVYNTVYGDQSPFASIMESDNSTQTPPQVPAPVAPAYVPSATIKKTAAVSVNARILVGEQKIAAIESSVGLDVSGYYLPSTASPYISTAVTVKNAAEILAANLRRVETTYETTVEVDRKIADLVASAPATLDTLKEIADALGSDPHLATTLISTIGAENARATYAEETLSSALGVEEQRAMLTESGIISSINTEINRATYQENYLSTLIGTDYSTARTQEALLSTMLASEVSRAIAEEQFLSTSIFTEIQRALMDDNLVSSLMAQEQQTARSAEADLSTMIYTEKMRAIGQENSISTNLASESSYARIAEQTISSALASESFRAVANEQGISSNLAAEIARAISIEQFLSTNLKTAINNEIARATMSEQTISTNLGFETVRAVTAEQLLSTSLKSTIIGEELRAVTAEQLISTGLGVQTSNYVSSMLGLSKNVVTSTITAKVGTISTISTDYINAASSYVSNFFINGTGSTTEIIATSTIKDVYLLTDGVIGNASTNSIRYSEDGLNWLPALSISTMISQPAYIVHTLSNGLFAAGTGNGFYTSADGRNWELQGTPNFASGYMKDFHEYNGMIVAVGAYPGSPLKTIRWSVDGGKIWNDALSGGFTANANVSTDAYAAFAIKYSNGVWVAAGYGTAYGSISQLQYSTDGKNWSAASHSIALTGYDIATDLETNGSRWVATTRHGAFYSANGSSWTLCTGTATGMPTSVYYSCSSVAWSPSLNLWIMVGYNNFQKSTDGITWAANSAVSTGASNYNFYDVEWCNDRFIVTIESNIGSAVIYSKDGVTWASAAVSGATPASNAGFCGTTFGRVTTITGTSTITVTGSSASKISLDAQSNVLVNGSSITRDYTLTTTFNSTNTSVFQNISTTNVNLTSSITAEQVRAIASEQGISSNLASEKARAITAEQLVSTNLGLEVVRAVTAEQGISSNLASEVVRATIAEQLVSTNLGLEDARARAAELVLRTDLASEVVRANAAEQLVSTNLGIEGVRAVAAELVLRTDLASEVVRATIAEQLVSTNLGIEDARAHAAELVLRTDLASEVARATGSEQGISSILGVTKNYQNNLIATVQTNADGSIIPFAGHYTTDSSSFKAAIDSIDAMLFSTATTYAPYTYVDMKVADLIDSAPGVLDTLKEIATALGDDPNLASHLISSIGAESTRAQTAEFNLSTAINDALNSEITRAVTTETTNLIFVSSSIYDEYTRALAAERLISTNLGLEDARAHAAELVLRTDLASEVVRATIAEQLVSTNLGLEDARAHAAELVLRVDLASEVARAVAAEQLVSTNLGLESVRAVSAESVLTTNLLTEVLRANTEEALLNGKISAEKARAEGAELVLRTDLSSEVARALAAEQLVSTNLGLEDARAHAAELVLRTDLASEVARALAAEQNMSTVLHTEILDETARAVAAELVLRTDLSSEVARAVAAEQLLSTNIKAGLDAEILRATTAEQLLSTNVGIALDAEMIRATAAENNLSSVLHTEILDEAARAMLAESTLNNKINVIDTTYVKKDGSVPFIGHVNLSNNRLMNVAQPQGGQDAINVDYLYQQAPLMHRGHLNNLEGGNIYNATDLNQIQANAGSMYRVYSPNNGNMRAYVKFTDASVQGSIVANNEGEYTVLQCGSLNVNQILQESNIMDITEGDDSFLTGKSDNAYDLTINGRDLMYKYGSTGKTAFRIPLNVVGKRIFRYRDDYTTDIITSVVRAGDILQFIGNDGGNLENSASNLYRKINYVAPFNAATAGRVEMTFINKQQQPYMDNENFFYFSCTNTGVTFVDFRRIAIAKNGDFVIKSKIGAQWDIIDNNDTIVEGKKGKIVVSGLGPGYTNQTIDISPDYLGQQSINTVGNVTNGTWNAATIAEGRGGTGKTSYSQGDLLVGLSNGLLNKLNIGANKQVLEVISGTPSWVTNDTTNMTLANTTNFPGIADLQQALDYLFNFTQTRKVIQHVVTNNSTYSDSLVPNVNFALGKVHFISVDVPVAPFVYLPPAGVGSYTDGTVYRIVHNGTYGDADLIIRYLDNNSQVVDLLELAARDSISIIWDADTLSYLYAVGV